MGSIIITIPPGKFDDSTYLNEEDCYIAKALKALGHQDVRVGGFGCTKIGNTFYRPTKHFDALGLIANFEKKVDTQIALEVCERTNFHPR